MAWCGKHKCPDDLCETMHDQDHRWRKRALRAEAKLKKLKQKRRILMAALARKEPNGHQVNETSHA